MKFPKHLHIAGCLALLLTAALPSTAQISREEIVITNPETVPAPGQQQAVPDIEVPEIATWREYIAQPFSMMKDKKLKQISQKLETLPDCKQTRAFRQELQQTLALKAELDGYWEVAKRPYEFEAVEQTKEKVYQLEKRVNAAQAEDIHTGLLTVLVRFRNGAKTLQEIVTAFEAIVETVPKDAKGRYIRQPDTKRKLVAQFEEVLNQHHESVIMRIKDNPYLRNLYSGYVDGMRMNPFNTGLKGVRNQIMSQNLTIPEE